MVVLEASLRVKLPTLWNSLPTIWEMGNLGQEMVIKNIHLLKHIIQNELWLGTTLSLRQFVYIWLEGLAGCDISKYSHELWRNRALDSLRKKMQSVKKRRNAEYWTKVCSECNRDPQKNGKNGSFLLRKRKGLDRSSSGNWNGLIKSKKY